MRESIPLDGRDWEVRGYLGVDAAIAAARRADAADRRGWLPASVPGSVADDLWRAGEIPDPYVDGNSLLAEWIPERAWLYRRRLPRPESLGDRRAVLRFDGIDYAGEVFVDGESVGRHEGMYTPLEIDVTERLGD